MSLSSFPPFFFFSKVLKAIGLQRTGKQDEAFSLAQEVSTLEPTDDNSLQALTILYREMHRREYTDVHKQRDLSVSWRGSGPFLSFCFVRVCVGLRVCVCACAS